MKAKGIIMTVLGLLMLAFAATSMIGSYNGNVPEYKWMAEAALSLVLASVLYVASLKELTVK